MDWLEENCEGEWLDWYRLTPLQRWHESGRLWAEYLRMGGSLDPEPDTESPFYDGGASASQPRIKVVKRNGIRMMVRED